MEESKNVKCDKCQKVIKDGTQCKGKRGKTLCESCKLDSMLGSPTKGD